MLQKINKNKDSFYERSAIESVHFHPHVVCKEIVYRSCLKNFFRKCFGRKPVRDHFIRLGFEKPYVKFRFLSGDIERVYFDTHKAAFEFYRNYTKPGTTVKPGYSSITIDEQCHFDILEYRGAYTPSMMTKEKRIP